MDPGKGWYRSAVSHASLSPPGGTLQITSLSSLHIVSNMLGPRTVALLLFIPLKSGQQSVGEMSIFEHLHHYHNKVSLKLCHLEPGLDSRFMISCFAAVT